jgi:uncharacterized protein DUF3105
MSSRQEEKEARRQERLSQEQADARAAARLRRVQLVLGGLIGVAAVVGIVFAVAGSGGEGPKRNPGDTVAIPPQKVTNLAAAARAAGCVVRSYPEYGHDHTKQAVKYRTNPPTSGDHNPVWAEDGIYAPGKEPGKEHWVHSLEHGRIITMYRPGTSKRQISQLETLFDEEFNGSSGYHQLLLQNNTKMPYAVAAVAWRRFVGCKTFNPRIFDAIRAFRTKFVDQGREFIP